MAALDIGSRQSEVQFATLLPSSIPCDERFAPCDCSSLLPPIVFPPRARDSPFPPPRPAARVRELLTLAPLDALLVEPESVRQPFNDTDADQLWMVIGAPPEGANTLEMAEEQLKTLYPDGPKALPPELREHKSIGELASQLLARGLRQEAEPRSTRVFSWVSQDLGRPVVDLEDKEALNSLLDQ